MLHKKRNTVKDTDPVSGMYIDRIISPDTAVSEHFFTADL